MNKELQRWLISSGLTFLAPFLLVIATNLSADAIINWNGAAIVSLLLVALRAGLKALVEFIPVVITAIKDGKK